MTSRNNSFFDHLISPLSREDFWNNYFETEHYFNPNNLPDFNFTFQKFEQLLWAHKFNDSTDVQVNKDGKSFFYNEIACGKDHFGWLMDRYAEGCTLIFNGIDKIDHEIAQLARELDVVFKGHTTVNAFLTPPDSKGFLPHFDTHDVFICQTVGEKEWRLYNIEMELPVDRQIYLIDQEKKGEPKQTYRLKKGNVLYIPRGIVHGSFTSGVSSLHLTVGVRPLLSNDYLKQCIDVLTGQDVEFRKSLHNKDPEQLSEIVKNLCQLIEAKSGSIYFKKLVNEKVELGNISHPKPLPANRIENINLLGQVTPETKVRNVYYNRDLLLDHAENIRLHFPGIGISGEKQIQQGYIELSAITFGAIEFIRKTKKPFSAMDLPEFYPMDTRLMLIKSLLKSGYLECV